LALQLALRASNGEDQQDKSFLPNNALYILAEAGG